jgi:hypothetical protein
MQAWLQHSPFEVVFRLRRQDDELFALDDYKKNPAKSGKFKGFT